MPRNKGQYREWRSCSRKARFKHEHEANHRASEYGLRAYSCENCNGWHLTASEYHAPTARAPSGPPAPRSDKDAAHRKFVEAKRVLTQLQAMVKKGTVLPKAVIERAEEAVRIAQEERKSSKRRSHEEV